MPSGTIIPFVILPVSLIHDRNVTDRAHRINDSSQPYKATKGDELNRTRERRQARRMQP
jgi:hypothetical protein